MKIHEKILYLSLLLSSSSRAIALSGLEQDQNQDILIDDLDPDNTKNETDPVLNGLFTAMSVVMSGVLLALSYRAYKQRGKICNTDVLFGGGAARVAPYQANQLPLEQRIANNPGDHNVNLIEEGPDADQADGTPQPPLYNEEYTPPSPVPETPPPRYAYHSSSISRNNEYRDR